MGTGPSVPISGRRGGTRLEGETMGDNGQISCNNPNYTWQDGACKPYRGRY